MNAIYTLKTALLFAALISTALSKPTGNSPENNSSPQASPASIPAIIVTANRWEELAQNSTQITTIITRDEIERRGATLLAQALNGNPGSFISPTGTSGQQTSLFTRGTESNHTTILIDGRRLNPNLDSGYDLASLSLDNVERVEIIRSPAASLYGADTIGGVVNIITRDGRSLEKPEHWLKIEAGSFQTLKTQIGSRGRYQFFDYAVEAGHFTSDFQRDNNQTRQWTGRGHFGFQISKEHYLALKTDINHLDAGIPGNRFSPTPQRSNLTRETWSITPEWRWQTTDNWLQVLSIGHNRSRQAVIDTFDHNRIQYNLWQLDYRSEVTWDKVNLVTGLQTSDAQVYRFNAALGSRDIENSQTQFGLYTQAGWQVLDRLQLTQSLRYDHYSDFPEAWTHRTGIAYRLPKTETLLRASFGRAYSPPTAQDLYFPFFSNPALRSEKSEGWEAGFEQPLYNKQLHLHATYFYNRITDLIQFSGITFRPENIGKATTEGVELGTRWTPIPELQIDLQYTYLTAQDRVNNTRLLRRPRHTATLSITGKPHPNWDLGIEVQAVWDREDIHAGTFARIDGENYWLWNANVAYQAHERVRLFAQIENILDEKYEVVHGYPALSRAIFAGVRISY
jgi:vitamin B12 transporter